MSTSLYQEAILEAQQLRKAAEDNATRAVVEAISPRIRALIERQILSEDPVGAEDDILLGAMGDLEGGLDGDVAGDPAGVSLPDEAGKVTLDLDSLTTDDVLNDDLAGGVGPGTPPGLEAEGSDELLLNMESARALMTLREAKKPSSVNEAQSRMRRIRHSLGFGAHLIESDIGRETRSLGLLGRLCDKMLFEMGILEEGVIGIVGTRSNGLDSEIKSLRKEIMEMATRKRLTEMDVMLKLALPDDVELDLADLDVEVLPGEGEGDLEMVDDEGGEDLDFGGEEEELDVDVDDEEGEMELEADDMGLNEEDLMLKLTGLPEDDFDLSALDIEVVSDDLDGEGEEGMDTELDLGDEGGEEDMADMDVSGLADDEVVEIDEGMLKRELARMRRVAEGAADDPKVLDDFGGAAKEREAFVDSSDSDLNKHDAVGTVKVEARVLNKLKNESRQNRALRKQVAELQEAVDKLSKQLNEQNLFNAKLLYVNRLVHSKALSEGQIKSIVESLDNAKTLREVKLLYKGFTDSLGGKRSKKSGSLTETAHRSAGGSSRRRGSASSSARGGSTTDRWAQLAGIPSND